MTKVTITVNGRAESREVEDRTLLVQFLRDNLGLTGTHVGCDTSQCGACVVHMDGVAVKSCTVLAAAADGSQGDDDRGSRQAATSCIRCRRRSASITDCSAASVRPA